MTERADADLREARAFFRATFDVLPEQIALVDGAGMIVDTNAAWSTFARENGLPEPFDWRGTDYLAICDASVGAHSAEASDAARGIREVLAGERSGFRLEYPCHSPTEERWFRLRALAFEAGGRPLAYVAHVDVTDRVVAERALRASEARYRNLVESSHEGICTVDASGQITYANGRLAELLGYDVADLTDRPIFQLMDPQVAFAARTRFARRALGIPEVGETPFLRRDGRTMWARESASSTFDTSGAFVGAVYVIADITEHRAAQHRLAASERYFRALTEQSSGLVLLLDAGGAVRYANPAALTMFGDVHPPLVGRTLCDLVLPADLPLAAEQLEGARAVAGATVRAEYRVVHHDGRPRTLRAVAHNLLDDPAVAGIVFNADDVTASRQAEDALRAQERHYRLLFERNPLPMYVADAETRRFLAVNDATVAHYGYTRDEFLTMRLDDLRPVEDRAAFVARFRSQATGVHHDTYRHVRKDGSRMDVEVTADQVIIGDRAARLIAVNDVTERVRSEARVRQTRREMELLLAATGDGIYAIDAEGCTTFVNPTAVRLFGGRAEDILGHDLHAVMHHSHRDGSPYDVATCPIFRTLATGTVARIDTEVFWRMDGTSYPVEYVATPLREDDRIVGVVVVFQDISERRHLEMQLRQSQKMEAVGQLAGGVAHDFNNLLTVITSYTLMLLSELGPDDPARLDLGEIQTASERAAGLTRQLLAFSRQQVLDPRVFDLGQVVAGTATMLRRLVNEGIELTITGGDDRAYVRADPGQIEQVIMNLTVNARDAMPSGGRVTIDVGTTVVTAGGMERYAGAPPGKYVSLTVRDSGCGMDEATRARIFDPFFTTKAVGKGTGLGLATVHGIVRQSGGYIAVESAPGAGSTFRIFLPRVQPPAAIAAAAVDQVDEAFMAPRGETLLLVEDEPALRTITERMLHTLGYTVLAARDGLHALEVAAGHDGPIHLLISDVVMPRLGGPELADRLMALHGAMPVLFMTGYSLEAVGSHGALRPAARLLHKPFVPNELARAVSEALHGLRPSMTTTGEHAVPPAAAA